MNFWMPLLSVIPLQLLAYHIAVLRGRGRGPAAQSGQGGDGGVAGWACARGTRGRDIVSRPCSAFRPAPPSMAPPACRRPRTQAHPATPRASGLPGRGAGARIRRCIGIVGLAEEDGMQRKIIQRSRRRRRSGPTTRPSRRAGSCSRRGRSRWIRRPCRWWARPRAEQAQQALNNAQAIVEAGRAVRWPTWSRPRSSSATWAQFAAINEVYPTFFTGEPPARSVVEVSRPAQGCAGGDRTDRVCLTLATGRLTSGHGSRECSGGNECGLVDRRGLQILLSGAFTVRGGFDSHTFPPSLSPSGCRRSPRRAGTGAGPRRMGSRR